MFHLPVYEADCHQAYRMSWQRCALYALLKGQTLGLQSFKVTAAHVILRHITLVGLQSSFLGERESRPENPALAERWVSRLY